MKRFMSVHIETCSLCNRFCSTCIRNSTPDKESIKDWFTQRYMPMEMIEAIIRQCVQQPKPVAVWLSLYNEPLLDPRLIDIAMLAKDYGVQDVKFVSNGDLMTPELAEKMDGLFSVINFSIYKRGRRLKRLRGEYLQSLFKKTQIDPVYADHFITHYNPAAVLPVTANYCRLTLSKLVINHRGEYLLCCEEMIPHFDLGKFPDISLADYWWGKKHRTLIQDLLFNKNRQLYPYCVTCPGVSKSNRFR